MDERELEQADREQEQLEWERAELEREALIEARLQEEDAIRRAGGTVEELPDPFDFSRELPEETGTEDVPF